jgi:nucleotide-binding universal stress UspA family protein
MSGFFSKVMLPLDGSAFARQASPQAAAVAQCFDSKLVLYSVLDNPRHAMKLPLLESDLEELDAGVERRLHATAERTAETLRSDADAMGVAPANVEVVVEAYNNPAEAIVRYAKDNNVDLIVMCTHGRGGLDRRLHGSVAESVLRHAPCPVMLVRATDPGH